MRVHLRVQRKEGDEHNRIYALASDLLNDDAANAIVMLRMDATWTSCLARRVMPLPTQDCSCHRVQVVDPFEDVHCRSVVVTEMASSKLLQIKVRATGLQWLVRTHPLGMCGPCAPVRACVCHAYT